MSILDRSGSHVKYVSSPHRQSLPRICPRCKSPRLEQRPVEGMHHTELRCADCGRHVRWVGRAVAFDQAMALVLTFGKYAGSELGRVPIAYVKWLATKAERVDRHVVRSARAILEAMSVEGGGR